MARTYRAYQQQLKHFVTIDCVSSLAKCVRQRERIIIIESCGKNLQIIPEEWWSCSSCEIGAKLKFMSFWCVLFAVCCFAPHGRRLNACLANKFKFHWPHSNYAIVCAANKMKPSVSVGCKYFRHAARQAVAVAVAKKQTKPNRTQPKPNRNRTKSKPGRTAACSASLKTPNRYANSATTNEAYTQIAKRAELSWVELPRLPGEPGSLLTPPRCCCCCSKRVVVLTKFVVGSLFAVTWEKTAENCVCGYYGFLPWA